MASRHPADRSAPTERADGRPEHPRGAERAEPAEPAERTARTSLRTDLPPAGAVGVLMGFVAAQEGSGAGVAVVVGTVGCALVLGMLALKRALHGQ